MKFGRMPVAQAGGAILAHSIRSGDIRFKKGRVLDEADLRALSAAGIGEVVAAKLEAGECGEDEAAERVTRCVIGRNLSASAPFTGRSNLYSDVRGLLVYDRARLDAVNLVDESVTIAALPPDSVVMPRQMAATIKIIPYGVSLPVLEAVAGAASPAGSLFRVAPFTETRAGLVQSGADTLNARVLDKTRATVTQRLERLGSRLVSEQRCRHHEDDIAGCLEQLAGEDCGLVLVAGASATADRRDVVPSAITAAGGRIIHMGMPVEPGNLLLLGETADGTPVICLPGCARSPALNGFDWVLERLLAGLPVRPQDIMRMGAGGLIKHQPAGAIRGAASREKDPLLPKRPEIGAVVLAAGDSTRMGGHNKLLQEVDGEPMVCRAVRAAEASHARPVVVVAGYEAGRVRGALSGRNVTVVENADYSEGLSTSLRRGLAALPGSVDGAVICLGDMPWVGARDIDRVIAAFSPDDGRLVCIATHRGRQGHPVLWARRFFDELEQLRGDAGAKSLLDRHREFVCEVEAPHDGVLRDVDDTGALAEAARA